MIFLLLGIKVSKLFKKLIEKFKLKQRSGISKLLYLRAKISDCEKLKIIHKKTLTLIRTGSKINKLVKDK